MLLVPILYVPTVQLRVGQIICLGIGHRTRIDQGAGALGSPSQRLVLFIGSLYLLAAFLAACLSCECLNIRHPHQVHDAEASLHH
jgi:hypothetical protein